MPIIGLTDTTTLKNANRGIPIVGDLRKGEPKENGRMGKDRADGSWRVTFREGYEGLEEAFNVIFPDTSNPFIIATVDETPDAVFNDAMRLYGGNGMAKIVCDGANIQFSSKGQPTQCMNCLVHRDAPPEGNKKHDYCAPMAYFRFTLPTFNQALGIPGGFLFQFSVTAESELQHLKKELDVAYQQNGTLTNKIFMLYRSDRTYNRDGSSNTKSLAYISFLDRDLNDQAIQAQRQLDSGDIEPPRLLASTPQIESGSPQEVVEGEFQDARETDYKLEYINQLAEWIEKRFGMSHADFFAAFRGGTFSDVEELYEQLGNLDALKDALMHFAATSDHTIRILGCRTETHNRSVRMAIPFGFGAIYSYTRDDFKDSLAKPARAKYTNADKKKSSLADLGNHAFLDVFGVEELLLSLKLNGKGNFEVQGIYNPLEDIPF